MLRKNNHILYGTGIVILLLTLVIRYNHHRNTQPQEPVKIYNGTIPSKQVPKREKPITAHESTSQPISKSEEKQDNDDYWDTVIKESTEAPEELPTEHDEFADPSESLAITQAEVTQQKNSRVIMLEEVFPEFDRLKNESQDLMNRIAQEGGMTPDNYDKFEATGKELEAQLQDYCQRIADEFPDAVTFVAMEGVEGAYDVDFQAIQDKLGNNTSPEIEGYFSYGTLRKMLDLPEIPEELLQQIRIN